MSICVARSAWEVWEISCNGDLTIWIVLIVSRAWLLVSEEEKKHGSVSKKHGSGNKAWKVDKKHGRLRCCRRDLRKLNGGGKKFLLGLPVETVLEKKKLKELWEVWKARAKEGLIKSADWEKERGSMPILFWEVAYTAWSRCADPILATTDIRVLASAPHTSIGTVPLLSPSICGSYYIYVEH